MSHALTNRVKYLGGLTFSGKSILFRLADESRDGTVFISVSSLALYAGCDERTVQRQLRYLVEKGVLIPTGAAGGRGHVQNYKIYLDGLKIQERKAPRKTKLIEYAPKEPPVNGAGPNGHGPPAPEREQKDLLEELYRRLANGQKALTWPDGNSLKARTVERGEQARQQLQALGEPV